jgi:hypothetical protein
MSSFCEIRKSCQRLQSNLYYMVNIHCFHNMFVAFEWYTLCKKSNVMQKMSHPILQLPPNSVFMFHHAHLTSSSL